MDETTSDIICVVCKRDSTELNDDIVLCDDCNVGKFIKLQTSFLWQHEYARYVILTFLIYDVFRQRYGRCVDAETMLFAYLEMLEILKIGNFGRSTIPEDG